MNKRTDRATALNKVISKLEGYGAFVPTSLNDALVRQLAQERQGTEAIMYNIHRLIEVEAVDIAAELAGMEIPEDAYYQQVTQDTISNKLELLVRSVLKVSVPVQPSNLPLVQTVSYAGALPVVPRIIEAERDTDTYAKGDAIMTSPQAVAAVGGEIVRRLQQLGYIRISKKGTKNYHITMAWSADIKEQLRQLRQAKRINVMWSEPVPYTKKHSKSGALIDACKAPLRNNGNGFISADTRAGGNALQSTALMFSTQLTQVLLDEYTRLCITQRREAQAKLDNIAYREQMSTDEIVTAVTVSKFDSNELYTYISDAFDEEGNPIEFYVRKGIDNTSRYYDNGRGYQQDGFLRMAHTFAKSVKLDEEARLLLAAYKLHLEDELSDQATTPKAQIKALGYTLKIAQIDEALESGYSNVIVEFDAKNGGVQVYAAYLADPRIFKYCGLDATEDADVYLDAVRRLEAKLNIPKGTLSRNEGKKPVMVWIYGAGMKTITLRGGEGWTGLYTLLQEKSIADGADYLKNATPDSVWDYFNEALEEMLPGVRALMNKLNAAHGRSEQVRTESGKVRTAIRSSYKFTNFLGTEASLRPQKTELFKVHVGWLLKSGTLKYHNLEMHAKISAPREKAKALAPLSVQSNDGGIVTMVAIAFHKNGLPLVTVHDAFGIQATDFKFLTYAYKRSVGVLLEADQATKIIHQLNEAAPEVPFERGTATAADIMLAKEPLSF